MCFAMNKIKPTFFSYFISKINLSYLLLLLCFNCFSQDYRNKEAYIDDFIKNEYHLNEKFSEYIIALKDNHIDSRISTTVNTILLKLNNLNSILTKNDKGWNNDVELRNTLIELNRLTIELIKNDTFNLTNYQEMSLLPVEQILSSFDDKEKKIQEYYKALYNYQETKIRFCKKHNISLKQEVKKDNVLEYLSTEGLLFYQVGVMDAKLIVDIKRGQLADCEKTFMHLKQVCQKSIVKNNLLLKDLKDTSLQKITDHYIRSIETINTSLFNDFKKFSEKQEELKKGKELYKLTKITSEQYSVYVKSYNEAKNKYVASLDLSQKNKVSLLEDWYKSNSMYMTNHIKLVKI